jgi:hypothetical protein
MPFILTLLTYLLKHKTSNQSRINKILTKLVKIALTHEFDLALGRNIIMPYVQALARSFEIMYCD